MKEFLWKKKRLLAEKKSGIYLKLLILIKISKLE